MAKLEIRRIKDQLDRAVNGPAWHGPSILQALEGVSAAQAAARPIPGAHSIWELVEHTTAWLDIVRQRVDGTAPSRIPESMNWPPLNGSGATETETEIEWKRAVSRLKKAAGQLGRRIASADDSRLRDELRGVDDTWSAYVSLHGVIQHVLYHAGQIALLKKRPRSSR